MITSYIIYIFESFSHLIHLIFVPWPVMKLWHNYVVTHSVLSIWRYGIFYVYLCQLYDFGQHPLTLCFNFYNMQFMHLNTMMAIIWLLPTWTHPMWQLPIDMDIVIPYAWSLNESMCLTILTRLCYNKISTLISD